MRVKILLLYANDPGKRLARFAGQILTDVSAAFGHVFSLIQDRVGGASVKACGAPLTEKTLASAAGCDAVLLLSAPESDQKRLLEALKCPVRIDSHHVPAGLCGRHEAPVSLWTAQALSDDAETLRDAAEAVFRYAAEYDMPIACVAPERQAREAWEKALKDKADAHPGVSVSHAEPVPTMRAMILSPDLNGIIFCPPYTGALFGAAAGAASAYPTLTHAFAPTPDVPVFGAGTALGQPVESPFSLAFAIADLLRCALHMENEAACVEAALNNVLLSGWRTPDLDNENAVEPEKTIQLICEQISVAGELMHKGAF